MHILIRRFLIDCFFSPSDFIILFVTWIINNISLASTIEFWIVDGNLKLEKLSAELGIVEG